MPFRNNQKRRRDPVDYGRSSAVDDGDSVLRVFRPGTRDDSSTALNLVRQAAEIFGRMEDQALETEARAESLCKSFEEKLRLAEEERVLSERIHREAIKEISFKLQEISGALRQAQSRLKISEERAAAAEFRAQAAETQLSAANRELAAVEKAIRTRLL
jgi:hypothetical protein